MNLAVIGYGKLGTSVASQWEKQGGDVVAKIQSGDIWEPLFWSADVVLESSCPENAVDNTIKCIKAGLPVIIGTTGWHSRIEELLEMSRIYNGTIFHATNFSIGVHLFNQIAQQMTKVMSQFDKYSPVINEAHHIEKLDSPSGTALTLKRLINPLVNSDVSIKSVREGRIVGLHELSWKSKEDELVLRHEAISRNGFALGAVKAANWLIEKHQNKQHGIYTMNDLISQIK